MIRTIGEILPHAARRYGDKPALAIGSKRFTFNELEALSNALANGLIGAAVEPGDHVALYGPNSWEWLAAYYAIAKTGAVVIPINVMLTPEEVGYIVRDSGTKAIIAAPDKGAPLLDIRGKGSLSHVVL